MELLTQCIRCGICQDSSKNIYESKPDVIYSSGFCCECFTIIVRKKQIDRTGSYCFGSENSICQNPQCSYRKKCDNARSLEDGRKQSD